MIIRIILIKFIIMIVIIIFHFMYMCVMFICRCVTMVQGWGLSRDVSVLTRSRDILRSRLGLGSMHLVSVSEQYVSVLAQ